MKLAAIILMLGIAGCASVAPPRVQERAAEVRQRTAAMDAATQRIAVVEGTEIAGHPNYITLGPVGGYCERTPQGDTQTLSGDTMKESAVRKYGDRVDAIIQPGVEWVPVSSGGIGYWRCKGTAVSFGQASAQ